MLLLFILLLACACASAALLMEHMTGPWVYTGTDGCGDNPGTVSRPNPFYYLRCEPWQVCDANPSRTLVFGSGAPVPVPYLCMCPRGSPDMYGPFCANRTDDGVVSGVTLSGVAPLRLKETYACAGFRMGEDCQSQCDSLRGDCGTWGRCNVTDGLCSCDIPHTYGPECHTMCDDFTTCGGVARCTRKGTCECHLPGLYGPRCAWQCKPETTCSGHGYCSHVHMQCVCDHGWHGPACNVQCDRVVFAPTGSASLPSIGMCERATGNHIACADVRFMPDAEAASVPPNSGGTWDWVNQKCICFPGWTGPACDFACDPGSGDQPVPQPLQPYSRWNGCNGKQNERIDVSILECKFCTGCVYHNSLLPAGAPKFNCLALSIYYKSADPSSEEGKFVRDRMGWDPRFADSEPFNPSWTQEEMDAKLGCFNWNRFVKSNEGKMGESSSSVGWRIYDCSPGCSLDLSWVDDPGAQSVMAGLYPFFPKGRYVDIPHQLPWRKDLAYCWVTHVRFCDDFVKYGLELTMPPLPFPVTPDNVRKFEDDTEAEYARRNATFYNIGRTIFNCSHHCFWDRPYWKETLLFELTSKSFIPKMHFSCWPFFQMAFRDACSGKVSGDCPLVSNIVRTMTFTLGTLYQNQGMEPYPGKLYCPVEANDKYKLNFPSRFCREQQYLKNWCRQGFFIGCSTVSVNEIMDPRWDDKSFIDNRNIRFSSSPVPVPDFKTFFQPPPGGWKCAPPGGLQYTTPSVYCSPHGAPKEGTYPVYPPGTDQSQIWFVHTHDYNPFRLALEKMFDECDNLDALFFTPGSRQYVRTTVISGIDPSPGTIHGLEQPAIPRPSASIALGDEVPSDTLSDALVYLEGGGTATPEFMLALDACRGVNGINMLLKAAGLPSSPQPPLKTCYGQMKQKISEWIAQFGSDVATLGAYIPLFAPNLLAVDTMWANPSLDLKVRYGQECERECNSLVHCNGNGVCSPRDGSCMCTPPFQGVNCGCWTGKCGTLAQGACNLETGGCKCQPEWGGPRCALARPPVCDRDYYTPESGTPLCSVW